MKLSVALRLGRVSNLPTVTSNVLAALALICAAMSMMYVAGSFLNEAFDRELDARERPARPIPSGQAGAAAVFDAGFALLIGGIAVIAVVALASGTGWRPVLCAIALGSLIVFYDAYHNDNPAGPIVLGLCRVGVYATAAFAATREVDPVLVRGMIALLGYLIGVAYLARQDSLDRAGNLWPLAVLALPAWLAFPNNPVAWVCYGCLIVTTRSALLLLGRRKTRDAVSLLIAGIALLDATLAANQGYPILAINAIIAFAITRWLQRSVPDT
jgi:UbiA prenyltransferase family protein